MAFHDAVILIYHMKDGAHRFIVGNTFWIGTFAANTLRRLNRLNRQTVYLTMDADPGAVRVLPTLLRQLKNNHYLIRIPMETRL